MTSCEFSIIDMAKTKQQKRLEALARCESKLAQHLDSLNRGVEKLNKLKADPAKKVAVRPGFLTYEERVKTAEYSVESSHRDIARVQKEIAHLKAVIASNS